MHQIIHPKYHWVAVSLIGAAALLAFEASGQTLGAGAVFEGRPAMSGAQGGLGAMAGPPTGGIGLQGNEGSRLNLRPPSSFVNEPNMPQGNMGEAPAVVATADEVRAKELAPAQKDRDPGIAKKERSASDKVRRSAQRTLEGAKYGISPVDTR